MPIIRKREIEQLAQMNGEELAAYIEKLPAPKEKIEGLFAFLENRSERERLDESLRLTMQFMLQNGLNFPKVSAWLSDNGGFSDAKVLENIIPEWRKAFPKS